MIAPVPVEELAVVIDGVTHRGTYYIQNKMLYVQSSYGEKCTQVGGVPPKTLASLLLAELVRSQA